MTNVIQGRDDVHWDYMEDSYIVKKDITRLAEDYIGVIPTHERRTPW